MLEQYLGVSATIGVSEVGPLGEISQGYAQAAACLKYRFCSSLGNIILWNQIADCPPLQESYSILPYRPKLEKAFAHRQVDELKECLAEIRRDFAELCLTPEAACGAAVELYSVLVKPSIGIISQLSRYCGQVRFLTKNYFTLRTSKSWLDGCRNCTMSCSTLCRKPR